jgi:uncharacterized protein (TIGR04255 family)
MTNLNYLTNRLEHRSQDRMIQIQPTRFHLNWRKRNDFYPSYKSLIAEFEETFARFAKFIQTQQIGSIELNQWELTYIDSFPEGQYWTTPADWSNVLPGLFGRLFDSQGLNLELEARGAEWSYEIKPQKGRLHIAARRGRWGDDESDTLLLHMTSRGPLGKGGAESMRAGLDIGHVASVETFLRVVDQNIQQQWK